MTIRQTNIRCVIVDDNPSFLEAARALLECEGLTVVGVAATSAEALERAAQLRPEVMLVDVYLGDESGFDLAQQLAGNRERTPSNVILISTYAERDFADLIDASAAVGFLPKSELSAKGVQELLSRNVDD